jgi:hypothetical protein
MPQDCGPALFEACAETLETVRFYISDDRALVKILACWIMRTITRFDNSFSVQIRPITTQGPPISEKSVPKANYHATKRTVYHHHGGVLDHHVLSVF